MIVIIYVNIILIYCKIEDDIDNFIKQMKSEDDTLHNKGTAKGHLGVDIKHENKKIILTQYGLTACIIKSLGLDFKLSTGSDSPADKAPLP
jgi:hypothetical protein